MNGILNIQDTPATPTTGAPESSAQPQKTMKLTEEVLDTVCTNDLFM